MTTKHNIESKQAVTEELSIYEPPPTQISVRELTPSIWAMIVQMAPVIYRSRLFGVTSVDQASAIMLKGFEMGLSISASFELIHVVKGKPGLSPRGAMALMLNSPKIKTIKIERLTKDGKFTGYSCYMERLNGFSHKESFSLEDANRAGLIKSDSAWEAYPENMCKWRAIGFCSDVVAPDITAGMTGIMKMPEQYGIALSEEGDVIDGTVLANELANEVETQPQESGTSITLDQLVDLYGVEQILTINDGKLPGTQDEVDQVAFKLAGV